MTERDNRAQDLVRTLLAEGWSQAEIARRIGRDPRLVRFVLKGLKPGTNLVEALTQLERGEEVTPPRRRHDRKGRTAKVRGKRGKPSHRPTEPDAELLHPRRSRAPQQSDEEVLGEEHIETLPRKRRHGTTPSTSQPERLERQMRKRNLLRHEVTNLPHHRSSHTLQFPRDNEDARGQASDLLTEILSEAAASGCTRNYGSKSMKVAVGSSRWCGWGIRAATTAVSLWKTCGCSGMRCRG
ncbi:ribonuclease E [Cutibacterium acnes JCM 18916]|nr:ribonuclease E [Cutibacterium acnes JCM 18916]